MRLPHPLSRVAALGLPVWPKPYDANLVVERGPGLPGDWDGVLTYAWTERDGGGWHLRSWPCATRPGRPYLEKPMNPEGTAILEPGRHKLSHRRGLHKGRPALVQMGPVTVRRDADRDAVVEPSAQTYTGLYGVNIHDVEHPNGLAGCIGLRPEHMPELLAAYDRLVPYSGAVVSLTLIVS
jgi:hypothetical protein